MFPSYVASLVYGEGELAKSGANLIVNHKYIVELNRIIAEGVTSISPKTALGLIGFPSFHMVMACMSVFYMLQYRLLFVIFAGTNSLMLPAIVVHGNHHLTDVLAGAATFAVAAFFAHHVVERLQARPDAASDASPQEAVVPEIAQQPVPSAGYRFRCSSSRGMISTKLHGR